MNSPPRAIESDPLLFDKLLAPLEAALQSLDQDPRSRAATKLGFRLFVRVLLFRLFAQIGSLRDLATDLRTSPAASALGLPALGLSTLHDAFARYPVAWVCQLSTGLLRTLALAPIPELSALGRLWCVDSSFWPVVRSLAWLERRGLRGVRLHLGLSLNVLCPALFVLSYDKSPACRDRQALLEMAEAGVTYIVDRGYVLLSVYLGLIAKGAFFLVRERNNLVFVELARMDVCLPPSFVPLRGVWDAVVRLERDRSRTVLRLVRFEIGGHEFHLLTNRWDLATWQVVMLYAWRWQVELIFRAWKHGLGALHLINLSESGIAIQFHILLIASVLWVAFEQEAAARATPQADDVPAMAPLRDRAVTPTARLSAIFRVSWRLARPLLRLVRNCLPQPLSFYSCCRAGLRP